MQNPLYGSCISLLRVCPEASFFRVKINTSFASAKDMVGKLVSEVKQL